MKFNNKVRYIENLYEKAYLCKASMDKSYKHYLYDSFTDYSVVSYKEFLEEKKKNPLGATVAMKFILEEHPILQPDIYEHNKKIFERTPEIETLIKECEEVENKNYPKTKLLRKKLIENDRINLNSVTPKMNFWEKLSFKFKNTYK